MTPAEDAYVFRSALLQAAAYSLQLPSTRSGLHAHAYMILDALMPEPAWALERAEHAARAAEQQPDVYLPMELEQLRRATQYAESRYDHDTAARVYIRIDAHALADRPTRYAARMGLVSARLLQARFDEALAAADLAEEFAGDLRARAAVESIRSMALAQAGRDLEARTRMTASLDAAREAGDETLLASAHGQLGVLERRAGNYALAETHFLQQQRHCHDKAASAMFAGFLGSLYSRTGRHEEARRCLQLALDVAIESGNPHREGFAHAGMAEHSRNIGELAAAETHATHAIRLLGQVGSATFRCLSHGVRANIRMLQGNRDGARQDLDAAGADLQGLFRARYWLAPTLRYWAGGDESAPPPQLAIAQDQLARMEAGSEAAMELRAACEAAEEAVSARRTSREPVLFRGFRPAEMPGHLRRAVVAQLERDDPDFQQRRPATWRALQVP